MNILVTGSSGFIGKALINDLLNKKYNILGLSKKSQTLNHKNLFCDLNQIYEKKEIIKKFNPEVIFHFAWHGIPVFSKENCLININNSRKLIRVLSELKTVKKIIITGSCLEYKLKLGECFEDSTIDKENYFPKAKNDIYESFKKFAKEKNFYLYWLRLFYVYGKGQRDESLIPTIINDIKLKKCPRILNLFASNDYVFIDDVVDLMNRIIQKNSPSGIYNVGSGVLTTNMKILQTIENIMIGTNEYSNILNKKNKCTPPLGFYANTSKAKKYLNWKQNTSLTKGIIKILKNDNG